MGLVRRYALTRIKAGDYLLPANDGQTLWRIAQYTEGPSSGLDWPRDREVWGVWEWRGSMNSDAVLDPDNWESFSMVGGMYDTRREAIQAALELSS